ncbi:MAG: site-specific DNA-methyltransferase [Tissierellales bacterium]|nr:site-specific DNA-methyltransferase [Tissierellales bacterium]
MKSKNVSATASIRKSYTIVSDAEKTVQAVDGDESETVHPLIKCTLAQKPEIHPVIASSLPVDPASYKILEEQICRGEKPPIIYVCDIEGKTYLLSDHMLMDIVIKHEINVFYQCKIDIVDTVDKAIWWILENSNTFPQYLPFVQIKILLDNLPRFCRLAKENKKLGGKHKNNLSNLKNFKPINCLSHIGKRAGCSHEYVNEVRYILKHGNAEDVKKCENGKAVTTIYKEVKKRVKRSPAKNAAHDEVKFNNPPEGTYTDQVHQGNNLDVIREMQCARIWNLAAMIFSQNYNKGVDYGSNFDDSIDHDEYIDTVAKVIYEGQKLGRDGMRVIGVFPQTSNENSQSGGDYRHSLLADLIYKIKELNNKYEDCNLRFWGHFDWYKNHAGGNVCQGSISASCPVLRPDAEYIAVWVKNDKKLENIHGYDYNPQKPVIFNDSDRDKYIIAPEELVHRLIKLFTHPLDMVLDPYCGSGTTLVAAKKLKRHFIGIDQNPAYCQMSKDRLGEVDEKGV